MMESILLDNLIIKAIATGWKQRFLQKFNVCILFFYIWKINNLQTIMSKRYCLIIKDIKEMSNLLVNEKEVVIKIAKFTELFDKKNSIKKDFYS